MSAEVLFQKEPEALNACIGAADPPESSVSPKAACAPANTTAVRNILSLVNPVLAGAKISARLSIVLNTNIQ
jgi:hypothetical protein